MLGSMAAGQRMRRTPMNTLRRLPRCSVSAADGMYLSSCRVTRTGLLTRILLAKDQRPKQRQRTAERYALNCMIDSIFPASSQLLFLP
jgi:hypothetical protein